MKETSVIQEPKWDCILEINSESMAKSEVHRLTSEALKQITDAVIKALKDNKRRQE